VRQNLGLVVGLQGRLPRPKAIVKPICRRKRRANVAYLKQMLSRKTAARAGPGRWCALNRPD
jgi:Flp pilus assembly protein TadD